MPTKRFDLSWNEDFSRKQLKCAGCGDMTKGRVVTDAGVKPSCMACCVKVTKEAMNE